MKRTETREMAVDMFSCDACGQDVGSGRAGEGKLTRCTCCLRHVCDACRERGSIYNQYYYRMESSVMPPPYCKSCWWAGAESRTALEDEAARHTLARGQALKMWETAAKAKLATEACDASEGKEAGS